MPLPKNWGEELVSEWLAIEGFMTESNVRLIAEEKGGVGEADLVGVRVVSGRLEIRHVEVGSLPDNFDKTLETVRKKFAPAKRKAVEDIVREKIGWQEDNINYRRIYIATYACRAEDLEVKLRGEGIELIMLKKLVREKVFKAIEDWKARQQRAGRRKTREITLPEPYWLLKLLDYLQSEKFFA